VDSVKRDNPPLRVRFKDIKTKWAALKAINAPGFAPDKIFAKAFMTPEEMRKDKLLRLKLQQIRASSTEYVYKIRRWSVVRVDPDTNKTIDIEYTLPEDGTTENHPTQLSEKSP
jgi:hypothetical protein